MIPQDFITEWRQFAPWVDQVQVEQDLILSRALVEIFGVPEIQEQLAFRGGTALTKIHFSQAVRYSEDLDFVQVKSAPIGKILSAVRARLDPWLGTPERNRKTGTVNLIYRFTSEGSPAVPMRLKIEINSREHFSVFGLQEKIFTVSSRWFSGQASISTYSLEEILATNLRALYQRRKGRDLFDLWIGLSQEHINSKKIIEAFRAYIKEQGLHISRKNFVDNLAEKLRNQDFLHDTSVLLVSGFNYDPRIAAEEVNKRLLDHLR